MVYWNSYIWFIGIRIYGLLEFVYMVYWNSYILRIGIRCGLVQLATLIQLPLCRAFWRYLLFDLIYCLLEFVRCGLV